MLRRIYLAANGRKELFAEEIFVEYMRFLDGYHTHICGFEETMIKADPDWKCNSSHIKEIASWIAAGYLGKTQLSYRLL